ncbi:MAG: hypothetical protein HWN66_21975 [Candidatus Helarchaeota archaeon]|nr:hypothetical protein [Candidatus Helarchaeota archaeon]
MKFKTKSMIATGIILFISVSAFLAGFLQENYSGQAIDLRKEIAELQTDLDRMEAKALSLTSRDIDFTYSAIECLWEAFNKDLEFKILNSTLLEEERTNYIRQIVRSLQEVLGYSNPTMILHMYRVWDYYSNLDDFYIATEETDGYDYIIPRELWDSYISVYGMPVVELTPSEWYGDFFSYDAIQALPLVERPRDPLFGEMFVFESGGIEFLCDYFLFNPVRVLHDDINKKLNKAENLEAQASRIGLGVAMTTVAVVLSAAMANRLNQRKIEREFEKIREKEDRLAKKKRDLISIPILIIAIILSLLGVILPTFLNL